LGGKGANCGLGLGLGLGLGQGQGGVVHLGLRFLPALGVNRFRGVARRRRWTGPPWGRGILDFPGLLAEYGGDAVAESRGAAGLAPGGALEDFAELGGDAGFGIAAGADVDMPLDVLHVDAGELAVEVLMEPPKRVLAADGAGVRHGVRSLM
jgi:hypothetical protein